MNDIYKIIRDRILAEITDINHIDYWKNQIAFERKEHPYKLPACFIEFLPIQWKTKSPLVQYAKATVRVRVVQKSYKNTHGSSVEIEILNMTDSVFSALHLYKHNKLGTMQRVNTTIDTNYPDYVVNIEDYTATFLNEFVKNTVTRSISPNVTSNFE